VPAGGHNVLEYSSNSISGVGTGQFQNICALTPFAHAESSPQEYPFANYRLQWFSIGPRRMEPSLGGNEMPRDWASNSHPTKSDVLPVASVAQSCNVPPI